MTQAKKQKKDWLAILWIPALLVLGGFWLQKREADKAKGRMKGFVDILIAKKWHDSNPGTSDTWIFHDNGDFEDNYKGKKFDVEINKSDKLEIHITRNDGEVVEHLIHENYYPDSFMIEDNGVITRKFIGYEK